MRPDLFRPVRPGRWAASRDRPFVVFLIGMRINRPWKLWNWLPIVPLMPRMVAELERDSASGFLGGDVWLGRTIICVQYWSDFTALEAYARNADRLHRPAWSAFNRRAAHSSDVGVWHETYEVAPGSFEAIYINMPEFGLGKAAGLTPASGSRTTARGRKDAAA